MVSIISMILVMVSFYIGVMVGQKLNNGEKITVPKKEDIPLTKEYRNNKKKQKEIRELEKEEKKRIEKINKVLENVNNYDGTGIGQRSVE